MTVEGKLEGRKKNLFSFFLFFHATPEVMLKRKTKWPALISLFSSMLLYIACEKKSQQINKKTRTEHNQGSTARWTFTIFFKKLQQQQQQQQLTHTIFFFDKVTGTIVVMPEWTHSRKAQQKERNNYEEVTRMFFSLSLFSSILSVIFSADGRATWVCRKS